MQADERTRTVVHHEWTLDTPAHHTEVAKALAVAHQKRDAEAGHPGDIVFTHGDDLIVIGYEAEQHPDVIRHAVGETLRADRDEWQRRAAAAESAVCRVRELAHSWAAHRYIGLTVGQETATDEARDALIRALGETGASDE